MRVKATQRARAGIGIGHREYTLYRINYGNGQVSNRMTEAEAIRFLATCDGHAFMQKDVGTDAPDGWIRWTPREADKLRALRRATGEHGQKVRA